MLAAGLADSRSSGPHGSFLVDVLPASLIAAIGMALAFIPSLRHGAIGSARPEEGGLASGIVSTSYQVGSALGLAAMTAVATAQGADQLGNLESLTNGFGPLPRRRRIAAAGALIAWLTLRRRTTTAPPTEPATTDRVAARGPQPNTGLGPMNQAKRCLAAESAETRREERDG